MRLRLFLLNALFCLSLSITSVWAVPAKPGVWRLITLVDGSEVRVQLVGDEFCHCYVAADGSKYVADDKDGLYRKLDDEEVLLQRSAARRSMAQRRQQSRMHRVAAHRSSLFSGTKKGLIILVEFTDTKFQAGHNQALYNRIANERGFSEDGFRGSVKDYFSDQSLGRFELDFDVVGICPLSHNTAYYGRNVQGNDVRPGEMVAEACLWAAQQGVDFSQYDWDGDGEVDQVFVLYAGQGEAAGGASTTIWPHMYSLSESDYGKTLSLNGVTVDTYACSSELNISSELDGIGTFCHEFSHCMGFPDLYDTSYSGWFGMGDFDLMNSGSYNGDSKCPAGYSAYEKAVCGWLDLKDMTDIEDEVNVSGLKPMSEGGDAYIIHNKAHEDEYYIVENRQKTHWDSYLPDAGVMITHVDYDENVWNWNVPNTAGTYVDENGVERTNDHQRLTIFHADNRLHGSNDYGHVGDLYGHGHSALTATTKPASSLYVQNSDGSYYMHVDIKDMVVASDGTASLTFSKVDHSGSQNPDTPVVPSGSTLLYESFDKCTGKGGNDNLWSGNIAVSKMSDADYDNSGWTSTSSLYEANACVRVAKSGEIGNITTPTFTVDGSATLSFKAAAWNGTNDATKLNLDISGTGATLSKYVVRLEKGAWSQFGATIYAKGNVKLTFTADKGRFFLDEVKVVDSSISGIREVSMSGAAEVEGYYTLDGIRLQSPRAGVCLVRYKDGTVRKVLLRNQR